MSNLVTKNGVPVQILDSKGHVYRKVRNDGKVEDVLVTGEYVRAVFPNGAVQIVKRSNLKEVK